MSEPKSCLMEACTCVALEGQYCSDYCERTAGQEVLTCACGHKECAGSAPDLDSAVG
jgi:hypothetical protein